MTLAAASDRATMSTADEGQRGRQECGRARIASASAVNDRK